ncbi:MAG: MFS transporter [Halieaceae bacterium]|jgi:MFS family permease|nr:MFS transporter [Halieaceae bacterium]
MYDTDAERDYHRRVQERLPRNFAVHLVHGLLGQTGFRLVSTPTFVPAYILLLSGGSDIAVGLALSLAALGAAVTPLFSASLIGHRRRVLPVGFFTGGAMRVAVLFLALAGLLFEGDAALVAALAAMALFGLFAGMQTVVFQTLLSKVIPVNYRGRLMGIRNFLASLTTIGVAWVGGNYLVGTPPQAAGYGQVFLLSFVLTTIGLLVLVLVREPEPPTVADKRSFAQYLREMPAFLRAEPAFARFVLARAVSTLGRMALPFYILYAGESIGLSGETLASLTVAFTVAATLANLFWGWLADQYGFRLCLLLSIGLWIAATLTLLLSANYWVVVAVFAAIGASQEGFRLGSISLPMEFGNRENTSLRLAIANTVSEGAGSVAPLLGGLVAAALGYGAVFLGASALLCLGLVVLLSVQEPRFQR